MSSCSYFSSYFLTGKRTRDNLFLELSAFRKKHHFVISEWYFIFSLFYSLRTIFAFEAEAGSFLTALRRQIHHGWIIRLPENYVFSAAEFVALIAKLQVRFPAKSNKQVYSNIKQ